MSENLPGYIALAAIGACLFLLFLPILVISSKGRLTLQVAALLLCCLGAAALFLGGITGAAFYGISLLIALPAAAVMWFAGLCCAIAAFFDSAHERRMKELTVRLLMNDARGLGKPDDYRDRWYW